MELYSAMMAVIDKVVEYAEAKKDFDQHRLSVDMEAWQMRFNRLVKAERWLIEFAEGVQVVMHSEKVPDDVA